VGPGVKCSFGDAVLPKTPAPWALDAILFACRATTMLCVSKWEMNGATLLDQKSNVCVVPTDGSIPPIIKRRRRTKPARSARVFSALISDGGPGGCEKPLKNRRFLFEADRRPNFGFCDASARIASENARGVRRRDWLAHADLQQWFLQLCSERSQYLGFLIHIF